MLDSIMNSTADFMNKVSAWLTFPTIPWGKFQGYWNEFVLMIAPYNKIFPLTDLVVIMGLIVAICVAMMIFYTVVLIKSFIPFSGGK